MIPTPPLPFLHRRKRRAPRAMAPAGPPVLVAASYVVGAWVDLGFDRAVDIDAISPASVRVKDPTVTAFEWVGTGDPTLLDGSTVRVPLMAEIEIEVGVQTLSVDDDNGIVAAVGKESWDGVEGLALPFG